MTVEGSKVGKKSTHNHSRIFKGCLGIRADVADANCICGASLLNNYILLTGTRRCFQATKIE
jgi:hypothetical protein